MPCPHIVSLLHLSLLNDDWPNDNLVRQTFMIASKHPAQAKASALGVVTTYVGCMPS